MSGSCAIGRISAAASLLLFLEFILIIRIKPVHSFLGLQKNGIVRTTARWVPSQPCRPVTCLALSSSAASNSNDLDVASLSARLKIGDQFDRWKFMQNLLDDFVEEEDIQELLYAVLDGFMKYPKVIRDMDDDEANVVIATSQQKDVVEDLLTSFQDQKQIDAITNPDTLSTLEQLLPDPQEDEDGFKSSWDAVIELHGRDLVKFMEEEGTDRWKAISIVARVLIHYEFLTEGIVDSPR